MFTNTYAPHVGGVARSVETLCAELTKRQHKVMVIAPSFEGHVTDIPGVVVRVPSVKHVGNSDYSVPIPLSRRIRDEIDAFRPDVVHSHHPFLLGHTALRIAASVGVPLVFTYHTRYDIYVRQFIESDRLFPDLARNLANGYANLADAVIVPSESMLTLLTKQGVVSPAHVIPTGIDTARFAAGQRDTLRGQLGLGAGDFVAGHLGRLTVEKNLDYLFDAVLLFLELCPRAHFVFAGDGPMRAIMADRLAGQETGSRIHFIGTVTGDDVVAFYAAIDVFAFASQSETQGLVVAEALAAGVPVVALDASGVRDALLACDGSFLMEAGASTDAYAARLASFADRSEADIARDKSAANEAAKRYSIEAMISAIEALYVDLAETVRAEDTHERSEWERILEGLAAEVDMSENFFRAVGITLLPKAV